MGSHLISSLITKNNTYRRVQSFVGCNITHATPRDASVGSRNTRDSSFKFQYAAVIKLLIRRLPVKISHFHFTHA